MEYISYSQYSTFTQCPRARYLSKVRAGEETQTWYLPMGTSVHRMIEDHLGGIDVTEASAEAYFYPLVEAQLGIEPDTSKWLAAGPKDSPVVEERALALVRSCFTRALEELEQIDVWEVEYDASGRLPGLDVPVRAFIDIVGEHKKKGPVLLDWKTGSTKPGNFQLETYGALLQSPTLDGGDHPFTEHGTLPFKGRYVMLKPGAPNTRYIDASVDPTEVGAKYQKVVNAIRAQDLRADKGFQCRFCLQQDNCLANAGPTPRAKYYDKSDEDGIPF